MWTELKVSPTRKMWVDGWSDTRISAEWKDSKYHMRVIKRDRDTESVIASDIDDAARKTKQLMMKHGKSRPPYNIDIDIPTTPPLTAKEKKKKP